MCDYRYGGSELDLFAHARNWKAYIEWKLRPYLGREVLEVGAGIGGTTQLLCTGQQERWVCLEPDAELASVIRQRLDSDDLPEYCQIINGTLNDLDDSEKFDTIIYVDVLEHIENDSEEMSKAAGFLKARGVLAVLAPAHQALFSPFDEAIGHYRRYNKRMLASAGPPGLDLEKVIYLDCVGLVASTANRLLLRRSMPTLRQIKIWDRVFVPCSRVVDGLIGHTLGKSILGIWRKTSEGDGHHPNETRTTQR